jgi:GDSL-like Lipase/Acylhydrolase family
VPLPDARRDAFRRRNVAFQSIVRICPGFARPPSTEGPDKKTCTDGVDDDDDGLVDGLEPACKEHRFVMVAFGDSYQSGEGVGLDATTDAYGSAYENGTNFSDSVGLQENTYTKGFVPVGGNSCHRALANYAKINRTLIEPGAAVVLVDRTCSGATVQPDKTSKPPIVGTINSAGPAAGSQIDQALTRLSAAGIGAEEVDLVTIGMGGNDAKFGDLVASCLIPSLARRLLEAYPNSPGELEGLVSKLLTCERVADSVFKLDDAIKALKATEVWAQTVVRNTFPKARILQLTYPNVLPEKSKAPAWCGGMRKEDVSYARKKSAAINDVIRQAAKQTRTEIVDVQASFGDNALCPRDPAWALTNGIDEGNFQREIGRLLNLDGNGEARVRLKLDVLVLSYQSYKDCLTAKASLFRDCDEANAWANVVIAKNRFVEYLQDGASGFADVPLADVIFANLVAPPNNTAERVRIGFDRSRGLFHPKSAGFEIVACKVRLQYNVIIPQPCPVVIFLTELATVNSVAVTNNPVDTAVGSRVRVEFPGFAPGSGVTVEARSTPRPLGSFIADSAGIVRTTITVPSLPAGVHHLRATGVGAGNVGVQVEIPLRIPGNPIEGNSFGMYLNGFDPEPKEITAEYTDEQITISYLGQELLTTVPDETGGIFIEVPVVKGQAGRGLSELKATSRRTGKVVTVQFSPTQLVLPGTS